MAESIHRLVYQALNPRSAAARRDLDFPPPGREDGPAPRAARRAVKSERRKRDDRKRGHAVVNKWVLLAILACAAVFMYFSVIYKMS